MVSAVPLTTRIARARFVALTAAATDGSQIPPDARATALMAYLGLALLGVFFVVALVIATRWIRRQVRGRDDGTA